MAKEMNIWEMIKTAAQNEWRFLVVDKVYKIT